VIITQTNREEQYLNSMTNSLINKLINGFIIMSLSIVISTNTHAEIRPQGYEISAFSGYWQGGRMVSDASYSGFMLSYHISRLFSLEYQQGWIPTTASNESIESQENEIVEERRDLTLSQSSFNLLLHLSPHRLTPYFNLGIGWLSADDNTSLMSDIGIGARYFLTPDLAIRVGLSMWISDYDLQAEPYEHFTTTFAVAYNFKGKRDIDNDGINNIDDKCPTMAEDKDKFEDTDGCPEKDNDEDKILDKDDKCPNEPEDKDEDRDEDGCPDLDDDNDGIMNEEDLCKEEAEDKDGFKDEDGCPDTDNDGDKILDEDDKCPNKPESMNGINDEDGCPEGDADQDGVFDFEDRCKTKKENLNGFKDTDGCVDKIPDDLSAILGYQVDLKFKKNRAKLVNNKTMKARLDQIALVMKKYKEKMLIQVASHHKTKAQKISEKRSNLIKALLLERGVKAELIQIKAVGAQALPTGDAKIKDWTSLSLVVKKRSKK
jgi:outer membrane protein OmpA-like peptidoglycan-associated protein